MSLGERNRVCANSGDSHSSDQQPISFAPSFAQHSTSKHGRELGHSVDGPALTGEDLTSGAAPYSHNAFTDKYTVGPITKVTEDIEPEQSVLGLPQPRLLPSLNTHISEDEGAGEAKSGPLQFESLGEPDKKASKGALRGGSSRGMRIRGRGEHDPKRKQQVSFYSQAHQNLKIKQGHRDATSHHQESTEESTCTRHYHPRNACQGS